MMLREFRAPKSIFPLLAGKQRGAPVGWHGERRCPILAASDMIGGLGMLLPLNRNVVRPDPDAA